MVMHIRPQDLAAKVQNGEAVYLLDVRQPAEHAVAALPGSVLIPLNELPARTAEAAPPAGRWWSSTAIMGCAARAAAFLESNGLPNVASLAGGIDAWSCEVDPSLPRY